MREARSKVWSSGPGDTDKEVGAVENAADDWVEEKEGPDK